ncbi:peroxiredoxin [Pelomonas sp. KK5]|uniref:peroxiredoxin n=1 Tax=Pelomonas sp. KK5 TaxID=1855730 RepID=UPI00097CB74C|nr:peroxiredoxin [Pelomonas sp. KK5]
MLYAVRRLALAAALTVVAHGAQAALAVGAPAPTFSTEAAVGGKAFRFNLADALKQGPVVLYFYPKAFTKGCTIEAHNFAEATDKFKSMGATVIGISTDDIESLKKFSVEECRNKFAVAADVDGKVVKDYDSALKIMPGHADRVSYLIGTDGRVAAVYSSLSPDGHVETMLKAVEQLKAR